MGTKKRAVRGRGGRFTGQFTEAGSDNAAGSEPAGEPAAETAGEEPGRVEPIAPAAAGGIAVEVDRAALLQEAAAIAGESPADVGGAGGATGALAPAMAPAEKAVEVQPAVRMLVSQAAGIFAPNWNVTRTESEQLADSLALVMAYWMPDGVIEPKYLALVSFGGAVWTVASARRDADGWRPLRAQPLQPGNDGAPAGERSAPLAL